MNSVPSRVYNLVILIAHFCMIVFGIYHVAQGTADSPRLTVFFIVLNAIFFCFRFIEAITCKPLTFRPGGNFNE